MENHQQTSFTLEIDNFSEKESAISSPVFVSGGCEWFVSVHPKGYRIKDHVSMFLYVANPESLRAGWTRRANYSFIMLNQSGKELKRTSEACDLFCAEVPSWGNSRVLPITKLQEEGDLENNKLIIKVEVKVVEIVHEREVTGKEMFNFNGFDVLYTQAHSVTWIFAEHPDIAVDFRLKNQLVKTAYLNVLLGLIETLNRPPQSLSEAELRNAHCELSELTEAGFKLDWLKKKLKEVSLERKNIISDGSPVEEELKEHVKNLKLELDNEKAKSSIASAEILSLEKVVSDLKLELDKERSTKSATSKLALLKDTAVLFWTTTSQGIRQRRAGYQKL